MRVHVKTGLVFSVVFSIIFSMLLGVLFYACGSKHKNHRVGDMLSSGKVLSTKEINGGVVATVVPSSTETQIIKGAIGNTSVSFPPGCLSIVTDVTVAEGETISSEDIKGDLALKSDIEITSSATPVEITSSAGVDAIVPFTIALDMPSEAALRMVGLNLQNLAVVYKVKKQTLGQTVLGVKPVSQLEITGNQVLFDTLYFGWFQVVIFSEPINESKEVSANPLRETRLKVVLSLAELPTCANADIGLTIYVKEIRSFKYCGASGWEDLDLRGPEGPVGAQGSTGATGPQGPGFVVTDKNGSELGALFFLSYPNIGMMLDTGAIRYVDVQTGDLVGIGCELSSFASNATLYFNNNNCSMDGLIMWVGCRPGVNVMFKATPYYYLINSVTAQAAPTTAISYSSRIEWGSCNSSANSIATPYYQIGMATSSFTPYPAPLKLQKK